MISSFQKQHQIKILPALNFDGRLRLREMDLNEVVKTVESVLPQYDEDRRIYESLDYKCGQF